jgi:hypothetical protein
LVRLRALVTITIFQLGDPNGRRIFYEGRARAVAALYLNLHAIREDPDAVVVAAARRNVSRMLRSSEPFANCLRCFHRLFEDSPDKAREVFTGIVEFLDTISPRRAVHGRASARSTGNRRSGATRRRP